MVYSGLALKYSVSENLLRILHCATITTTVIIMHLQIEASPKSFKNLRIYC